MMTDSDSTRRTVLKRLGAAGLVGGIGLTSTAGSAAASEHVTVSFEVDETAPTADAVATGELLIDEIPADGLSEAEVTVRTDSDRFEFENPVANPAFPGPKDVFNSESKFRISAGDSLDDPAFGPGDEAVTIGTVDIVSTAAGASADFEVEEISVKKSNLDPYENVEFVADEVAIRNRFASDPEVRIDIEADQVEVGETTQASVVLDRAPLDLDTASFSVERSSPWEFEEFDTSVGDVKEEGVNADDGGPEYEVSLHDVSLVDAGDSDVQLGTVTVRATETASEATLEVSDAGLDLGWRLSETDLGRDAVGSGDAVAIVEAADDGCEEFGEFSACDTDGDGLYRDFTGDGDVTQADVSEFQNRLFSDGVQNNPEKFDFSDDGSVSHSDVVALFQDISGF